MANPRHVHPSVHAAILREELRTSRMHRSDDLLLPLAKAAPRKVNSTTDDAIGRIAHEQESRGGGGSQSRQGSRGSGARCSVEVQIHDTANPRSVEVRVWEIVD